jgi:predicted phage terminase large subunit-like protein
MGLVRFEEYDPATRRDLVMFIERVFASLNPSTRYLDNFHIHMIAAALERVRRGECRRLIINVPPRSLKSVMASIAFPAWVLGHDPASELLCVSYGQELADKLARDCRFIMQQPWYQRLFPRTALSQARSAVHDFETTAGGGRLAASVGGPVTGRGGQIVIIDDPVKPQDALSDVERKRANDWFSNTLLSRLNDQQTGAIIIVMQRLHEDDFVGHVMSLDDWEVLSFPAIAQVDEIHGVQTPYGRYTHVRRAGEALHPAREPLVALKALRRGMGAEHFAAQYLQSPTPPGGGIIRAEWFRRYDAPPPEFDRHIQSWDTASKVDETNDYSVCTIWGVKGGDYYLLNVWRKKVEYPALKAAVIELSGHYHHPTILIEDKGAGMPLAQELRSEGITVTPYVPKGHKQFRMAGQSALVEAGRVWLPREAHWLGEFEHECVMFPKGRHDDQVDSMSQALDHARNGMREAGWWQLIQEYLEKNP